MFSRAWTALTAQKRRYGTPAPCQLRDDGNLIPISRRAERRVDPPAARLLGGQCLCRGKIGLAAQQNQHVGRLAAGQRLPHARIDRGRASARAGRGRRRSRGQRQPQETEDNEITTKRTHQELLHVPKRKTAPAIPTTQTGRRDPGSRRPAQCRKNIDAARRLAKPLAPRSAPAGHRQPADHDRGQRAQPDDQRPVHRRISGTKGGHRDGSGALYQPLSKVLVNHSVGTGNLPADLPCSLIAQIRASE